MRESLTDAGTAKSKYTQCTDVRCNTRSRSNINFPAKLAKSTGHGRPLYLNIYRGILHFMKSLRPLSDILAGPGACS